MTRGLAFGVLAALVLGSPFAQGAAIDEASGVNRRTGDESPAPGDSGIDNYVRQDEQLNLDKDDGVVRVLRVNQKNLVNDFVTAVFPIRRATPRELRDAFRMITGKEGGRAEVIRDKQKGENFLQVICPRFQLPYVKDALEVLDQDWIGVLSDGTVDVYYQGKHRSITEMLPIFDEWIDSDGATFRDPKNNAFHRVDEPSAAEATPEIMKQLDIPPPQILLEGALYEVDAHDDLKLGLDFIAWKNGPGRNLFEAIFDGSYNREEVDNLSSIFNPLAPRTARDGTAVLKTRGHYLAANALVTAAYVDFLASKGKAKVVARPRILTKSGLTGEFAAIDPIPAFSAEPLDPGPRGLVPRTAPETARGTPQVPIHDRTLRHAVPAHVGITLLVTPAIGTETTEAAVSLQVSDLSGVTPQGTPMISSREVESVVRLKDGEPFVLGGIRRNEEVQGSAKVPLLGSIPVLGYLFGGETSAARRTELVLVLTPTIRQGPVEAPARLAPGMADDAPSVIMERAKGANEPGNRAPLPMGSNPFGFDQWILDKE